MDGEDPDVIKKEIAPDMNNQTAELIIPDVVPHEDVRSSLETSDMVRIKTEPLEANLMDDDPELDNPYQCFECGSDCKSQGELIDHYENAHTSQIPWKSEYNGKSLSEEVGATDDPLAGDEAPDSPERTADVEGAQNDAAPHEVLLLYSCPCCGHSSIDWNHLAKHLEKHVQVTCLSCSDCMNIFSSSYRLKDYTGKDSSDQPHVCCHCSFKTQWYQVLKDHCITHHQNVNSNAINVSNNHDQNVTGNNSNSNMNFIPQTTLVQVVNSQLQSFPPALPIPCNNGQTGYMLLGNNTPDGKSAVVLNNVIPQVQDSDGNSQCVIPSYFRFSNLNPMVLAPLVQRHNPENGCSKIQANPTQEIVPRVIPIREKPFVPNQGAISVSSSPKSTTRSSFPKVPVSELVKKWSLTKTSPALAQNTSHNLVKAFPKQPDVPVHVDGNPSADVRGSSSTSRRAVKNKPCPYCSHMSRDSHSLKTHILIHTKEKPFACELCNYRATQRAHLKKHMAVHNGFSRWKKMHTSAI